MGVRISQVQEGRARGLRLGAEIAREFREARLACGKSQLALARAVGISQSQVSRFERGRTASVTVERVAALLACVGLELSLRAFPAGEPLRDAIQGGLLAALHDRTHPAIAWRGETGVAVAGDLRSWDALIRGDGWRAGIEAESRVTDVQALTRRIALKQRDDNLDIVILVLLDSRTNRRALRSHGDLLKGQFPALGAEILADLAAGRRPRSSGIAFLRPKRTAAAAS